MSNQPKSRPGGVLPIPTAVAKKANTTPKSSHRSPAPRLRLIVRRLPPGLTDAEFWEALGPEWQTGNGKVDWHVFKEGKVTKDPSKPSRPARAYLKVKDQSLLEALSFKVKTTAFKDAKNSSNDPCLVGPPSLEFAPYSKVPSGRSRHDGRQGTIDQDQEFIDFLQSLTEPITKSATNGVEGAEAKQEKVIITPLVQFIKEKKANKAKEKEAAAAAKGSKKNQEGKEAKAKGEARPTVIVKNNAAVAEKARVTKATQEAVKAANKSAAQIQSKTTTPKAEPKPVKDAHPPVPVSPAAAPPPKPERQRGNASAASRMIARDLGLAPKEPRTPRAARNASAATPKGSESSSKSDTQPQTSSTTQPTVTSKSVPSTVPTTGSAPAPPTGPKNSRNNSTVQTKQSQPTTQRPSKPVPQPSAGAKSAFLKHANPSQGVTEELLSTTFTTYGQVTRCEIDKKKGLGYVDFMDTEALRKAMAASPVKVGNGQVVVLENKSPYQKRQPQSSNSAQQHAGAANISRVPSVTSSAVGSVVTSPQPSPAVIASVDHSTAAKAAAGGTTKLTVETTPAIDSATSAAPASGTPTTPSAPKGARGGNAAARAGRGGAGFSAGRGGSGFNQNPNRGRGGFRGRGGRGGNAGTAASTTTTTTAANTGSAPSTPAAPGGQGGSNEAAKPTVTAAAVK